MREEHLHPFVLDGAYLLSNAFPCPFPSSRILSKIVNSCLSVCASVCVSAWLAALILCNCSLASLGNQIWEAA